MNISGVQPGDVVECDVRGEVFFALVLRDDHGGESAPIRNGERWVQTLGRFVPPRIVTARQIVGHYRKSKASR